MNNSSKLYRTTAWAIYFSLSLLTLSLSSCDYFAPNPFVTWKEEVKINDGRTIVVEQKKRVGGLIAREAWLSINLPDLDIHNIVWHEHLMPLVVIESALLNLNFTQMFVYLFDDNNGPSNDGTYGYEIAVARRAA